LYGRSFDSPVQKKQKLFIHKMRFLRHRYSAVVRDATKRAGLGKRVKSGAANSKPQPPNFNQAPNFKLQNRRLESF
jgi:hypothetical protein